MTQIAKNSHLATDISVVAFIVGTLACIAIVMAMIVPNPAQWQQRADDMSVTIVWTDTGNAERNCGALAAATEAGGCFRHETPKLIYVSEGMDSISTAYVVLHELAHVKQYRTTKNFDECDADEQAREWGSTYPGSYECNT